MLKLIINADDFGINAGCSRGIIRAMTCGVVSDTTFMVNMPYAEQAAQDAKQHGIRRIGLHLTLTCGKPVLPAAEVPSLVDENGNFYRKVPLMLEHACAADVEKEYRAQAKRFFELGMGMTHIDSHHHSHFYGNNLDIALKIAGELGVPARHHDVVNGRDTKAATLSAGIKTTEHFSTRFLAENSHAEALKALLRGYLENGCQTLEVMCHPGYVEPELMASSAYNVWRANELATLTSPEIKRFIRDNDIQLTSFDYI